MSSRALLSSTTDAQGLPLSHQSRRHCHLLATGPEPLSSYFLQFFSSLAFNLPVHEKLKCMYRKNSLNLLHTRDLNHVRRLIPLVPATTTFRSRATT